MGRMRYRLTAIRAIDVSTAPGRLTIDRHCPSFDDINRQQKVIEQQEGRLAPPARAPFDLGEVIDVVNTFRHIEVKQQC